MERGSGRGDGAWERNLMLLLMPMLMRPGRTEVQNPKLCAPQGWKGGEKEA